MEHSVRLFLASSFGAAAVAYAEHRPDYAPAAVGWALEPASGPRVLDLGAGTGKLTGTLVALGTDVIAVEPVPAMLTELRRALPGSAEAIPLLDTSVDAVLAGNALVWFDMAVAGPEMTRVHAPGGVLAGLWNVMDNRVKLGCRTRAGRRKRGHWSAWHAQQLARRDGRLAPSQHWLGRSVRLAGAGRVPARQRRTADSLVATRAGCWSCQNRNERPRSAGSTLSSRTDRRPPAAIRRPDADRRTTRPAAVKMNGFFAGVEVCALLERARGK